jgi:hypothetical protein
MQTKPIRKTLKLSRTTIRQLTEREVEHVVGAATALQYYTCGHTVANTCGGPCTLPVDTLPYTACCGGTSQ